MENEQEVSKTEDQMALDALEAEEQQVATDMIEAGFPYAEDAWEQTEHTQQANFNELYGLDDKDAAAAANYLEGHHGEEIFYSPEVIELEDEFEPGHHPGIYVSDETEFTPR